MKIAVFYAIPLETKRLLRSVGAVLTSNVPYKTFEARDRLNQLLFIETGVGGRAATDAFLRQTALGRPDIVISAGFGGALSDEAPVGTVILAAGSILLSGTGVSHSLEIPSLPGLAGKPGWLKHGTVVTLTRMTEKRAVRQLIPRTLPVPVCDMETYYLAAACLHNDVPFIGIRSVSDSWLTEIPPAFIGACDGSGAFSLSRAFSILIRHPSLVPRSVRLGLDAVSAARQLCRGVLDLLEALP
jgi:adenosylhomocysteine nucleosidase